MFTKKIIIDHTLFIIKQSQGNENIFFLTSIVFLWDLHVFDHALVDSMSVSKVLSQSKFSLVKLLADVTLVRLFFKVNQFEVAFGVAEVSEGSSAGQTFSAKLVNLGHAVPRCQR